MENTNIQKGYILELRAIVKWEGTYALELWFLKENENFVSNVFKILKESKIPMNDSTVADLISLGYSKDFKFEDECEKRVFHLIHSVAIDGRFYALYNTEYYSDRFHII